MSRRFCHFEMILKAKGVSLGVQEFFTEDVLGVMQAPLEIPVVRPRGSRRAGHSPRCRAGAAR